MKKGALGSLSLIAALVLGIACLVCMYFAPHLPRVWQVLAGLSGAAFVAFLVTDRKALGETFGKKTTRYGLSALVMSIIAMGIVIFVNMISAEHDWKVDITKNKIHTLSEQTLKVLAGLKAPVTLRAFVDPRARKEFDDFFDRYKYHSKNLKVEHIDLDRDPLLINTYKIKQAGVIIVETEARSTRVENLMSPDDPKLEEKLTNALIQVTKGDKKKFYFTSGHGERLFSETGKEGLSELKEKLESTRYNLVELPLLQKEAVPADAEIVMVAAPRTNFMEHELKMLEDYVRKGGKMMVMVEPLSTPTLRPFLEHFGAVWKPKSTVFEANPLQKYAGGNPLIPVVTAYDASHEITRDLRQLTFFPVPTPIEKAAKAPADLKIASLFSTSNRSLEVEMGGDKIRINEKTDRHGPLSLALAISGNVKGAEPPKAAEKTGDKKDEPAEPPKTQDFRLLVVGDADFASNGAVLHGANGDLLQNMLSWLAHEEDLIAIRPKSTEQREFELTESRTRIIHFASVILLPLVMLFSGFMVWASRRRR